MELSSACNCWVKISAVSVQQYGQNEPGLNENNKLQLCGLQSTGRGMPQLGREGGPPAQVRCQSAAVLSCVCCAVRCCAVLCGVVLCYAMLCYAMLCYAMLCYAMLCYAMLQVYQRYPDRFNIVHVACALSCLADKAAARVKHTQPLRVELSALRTFVDDLLQTASSQLPSIDAATATALLHSLARLADTGKVRAPKLDVPEHQHACVILVCDRGWSN